jgi:hypothetical protein
MNGEGEVFGDRRSYSYSSDSPIPAERSQCKEYRRYTKDGTSKQFG